MTIKEQNEIEKLEGQIDSLYADIDKYNIELDNYDKSGEDDPEKENAILDKIDATEEKIDELESKIDEINNKEQVVESNKKLQKIIIKEDYKKLGLEKGDVIYKEATLDDATIKMIQKKVDRYVDQNEHTKAISIVAKELGFTQWAKVLDLLDKMHNEVGSLTNALEGVRHWVKWELFAVVKKKIGKKQAELLLGREEFINKMYDKFVK